MLKQYQRVILNQESVIDDFLGEHYVLRRGQLGVIMEVCKRRGLSTGYIVEFFDTDGETVGLVTLEESDLLPFKGPDTHVA